MLCRADHRDRGSFTALHVRTDTTRTPPEVVDTWYANGVGRLKRVGPTDVEELESYTAPL